jgi:hypothetical protein
MKYFLVLFTLYDNLLSQLDNNADSLVAYTKLDLVHSNQILQWNCGILISPSRMNVITSSSCLPNMNANLWQNVFGIFGVISPAR